MFVQKENDMPIDSATTTRYYVSCDNCNTEPQIVLRDLYNLKELLSILGWKFVGDVVACPECASLIPEAFTGVTAVVCFRCGFGFQNPYDLVGSHLLDHAEKSGWIHSNEPGSALCPRCMEHECGMEAG